MYKSLCTCSIVTLLLLLGAVCVAGEKRRPILTIDSSGIKVRAPWAAVDVQDGDVKVRAPATAVDVQDGKVKVKAPATDVDVQGADVKVRAPATSVDVQPGEGVKVQAGPVGVLVGNEPLRPIKLGDYWVGVGCHPARAPLKAQLGLPEDQGLVVDSVVANGPAAKAGIQRYDVLIKAGDAPLGDIPDLVAVVEATKEQPLAIELIRGGERQTITLTPEKRPEEARPKGPWAAPLQGDWDKLDKWTGAFPWRSRSQFRILRPGTILPPGAPFHSPMPGNMSVSITKQGGEPAKIVVQRDDEKWELNEKELDKLPDDVRPHVQRMLGRVPIDIRLPGWTTPKELEAEIKEHLAPVPQPRGEGRLQNRLDKMNERIEQLRKSLDELRGEAPPASEDAGESQ